ncbi:peptidase G2 autoproteolytic cleavage domain-containing protein [Terasakiella sp.]|uniref:peptidase G2 autoproteolytic cleavage domain-containing protein n=1 Tax=Terasakiella sp. TaxID=2034861 RepID=UPI003AA9CD57
MATKNIVPRGNGEGSIGTSLKRWLKGWFNTLDVSGNVTLGQNIYLSGTDASIRTVDESAFIYPKNPNGDYWQRTTGNAYNDAAAHVFRNQDGTLTPLSITSNGSMNANASANVEVHRVNTTAAVTDLTPFVSYMNGNRRFRVNHNTSDTSILLNGGGVTSNEYSYIGANTFKDLTLGTNGRNRDLTLNAAGTEMSYHGYGQSWGSRLIMGYDANSGDAAIKAYSSGGNTSLRLGTSNAGVYSNQFHMNNLGNIGVGLNASTADRLFVYGGADRSGIYASINGVSNHGSIVKAANAAYEQYLNVWIASRAASPNFGYLTCMSSENGDLEFTLRGDGNAWADGSWNAGGADFAEYFEWVDGNPNNEDRRGWSVVLEDGKIRKALAAEIPFGVISARPTVVGDAAELKWADKYLKDDFNKYIMEDYEVVEWTETKVVQDATEAVYKTVTKEREVQATETITEDVSSIELIDGKYTKVVKTETKEVSLFDEFDLYEDGEVIGVHRVPRMITETYEVEELVSPAQDEKTEDVQHSYAVDAVPDGVVVPIDATRSTQQRRKLNPNYDENQEYVPRSERPEWDCVGLMGKLRVVKGEVVSPNWIKMRDVSGTVEEWLVR